MPRTKQHLAGCAAILRVSQGHRFVDPSAPTLREAAFWVYVRQCLYDGTIRREPLDIDFSLQLRPLPPDIQHSHPLARLQIETAWANQAAWNAACVVNFCYGGAQAHNQIGDKRQQWQQLWDANQTWQQGKPHRFNPIWSGPSGGSNVFADTLFIAESHGKLTQDVYHATG